MTTTRSSRPPQQRKAILIVGTHHHPESHQHQDSFPLWSSLSDDPFMDNANEISRLNNHNHNNVTERRHVESSELPTTTTTTTTATTRLPPKKQQQRVVYENADYVPPPTIVVPQPSSRTKKNGKDPSSSSSKDNDAEKRLLLAAAGQCFFDIGENLQEIAKINPTSTTGSKASVVLWNSHHHHHHPRQRQYFQEAGQSLQDIGQAWQIGDWEAVQYAALDASQTMKLIAQSLNHPTGSNSNNNDLQRALAGVAVELKCLSSEKTIQQYHHHHHQQQQPGRPLNKSLVLHFQGLCWRFVEASRALEKEKNTDRATLHSLERASKAAQSLAKLYGGGGAHIYFVLLPRRFQLWWRSSFSSSS